MFNELPSGNSQCIHHFTHPQLKQEHLSSCILTLDLQIWPR